MMSTVLITGASSGLGRELARLFARQGDDLILVARNKEKLDLLKEEVIRQSSSRVWIVPADLSRPEAPTDIYKFVQAEGLQVDILVNNAGFGVYGEFLETDFTKIARMYQVNVLSPMHLIRLFLPGMINRDKGHVVNVASMGAFFPGPLMAAYFAAKADMLSFTKALAFELKGSSIKMTVACPGPFKSGFQEASFGHDRNKLMEKRLPSSGRTAQEIFYGICRNMKIVIPGINNKILYWLNYVLPQSLVTYYVFQTQKRLSKAGL